MNIIKKTLLDFAAIPYLVPKAISSKGLSRREFLGVSLAAALPLIAHSNILSTEKSNRNTNDLFDQNQSLTSIEPKEIYLAELIPTEEIENPGVIPLGEGSDVLELARMLYGEAREFSQDDKYLKLVGSSALTRKEKARASLKQVLFDKNKKGSYQYNCFNENDPNFRLVVNPLYDDTDYSKRIWEKCYETASELILDGPVDQVTHYWVEPSVPKPYWAEGVAPKHRHVGNNKITRFYDLKFDSLMSSSQ